MYSCLAIKTTSNFIFPLSEHGSHCAGVWVFKLKLVKYHCTIATLPFECEFEVSLAS